MIQFLLLLLFNTPFSFKYNFVISNDDTFFNSHETEEIQTWNLKLISYFAITDNYCFKISLSP